MTLPRAGFRWRWAGLAGGCLLACVIVHFPMLSTGLRLDQIDPIDSRFNNYLLEHSYRTITADHFDHAFWSPPFDYPQQSTLAYSDVMISFGPLYWIWRIVGLQPDTAFQCWMISATALNFLLACLVLDRACGFAPLATWCGGLVFAVAGSRHEQLRHQQLYCQVYVLLALYGLVRFFQEAESPRSRRGGWIVLVMLSTALQLWGGFYIGFFLGIFLACLMGWALILPPARIVFLRTVRRHMGTIVLATGLAGMMLLPLGWKYYDASKLQSYPRDAVVNDLLPQWKSWLFAGWNSWMYRRWDWAYQDLHSPEEHTLCLGFFTSAAAMIGLWKARRLTSVQLSALAMLTMMLLTTRFGQHTSAWWTIRRLLPGASALRAVARVGLFMAIPVSIGVASFVHHFSNGRKIVLPLMTFLFILMEQIQITPIYDKLELRREVAQISAAIPEGAEAFFYSGHDPGRFLPDQVSAMFASLARNVPTVNGYSGYWPRELLPLILNDSAADDTAIAATRNALRHWLEVKGVDPRRVAWLVERMPQDNSAPSSIELLPIIEKSKGKIR